MRSQRMATSGRPRISTYGSGPALRMPRGPTARSAFGAPMADLRVDDLATPGTVFQIGVAPVRIDILTRIDGVDFDEAWDARLKVRFGAIVTAVLSKEHLLRNKRASGRLQDLADVERLEHGESED